MLMCASLGLFGLTLLQRGVDSAARRPSSASSSELRQLGALLEPLRAYVAPAQRMAALERARPRLEALLSAMSIVLSQPAHPLFPDVATAAADLRIEDLEPALRSSLVIARGESLAIAWTSVDRLQPIGESEIVALLEAPDHGLTIAGLRIASTRDPLPDSLVGAILGCVRSGDPRIRMLAISCVPGELDPSHTDMVLDLCDENPADAGIAALLGRVPPSERGLECLLSRVQGADADTMTRLQPAIRRYAGLEPIRKALWEIATDLDDIDRAARAMHCLEIAGEREPASAVPSSWPLRLQYGLARIRVANRELAGIDALLTVAAVDDTAATRDPETVRDARIALAALARLAPHATLEELRAWRNTIVAVPDEPLPTPSR